LFLLVFSLIPDAHSGQQQQGKHEADSRLDVTGIPAG